MTKAEFTGAQLDDIAAELAKLPVKDAKRRRYDRDEAVCYLEGAILKLLDDGHSPKDVVTVLNGYDIRTSVAKIKAITSSVNAASGAAARPAESADGNKREESKLNV